MRGCGSFQSTPPHGRRRRRRRASLLPTRVSIHASAREATPMTPREVRRLAFQSTPPHGRRRGFVDGVSGSDRVSIHASAREATRAPRHVRESLCRFNPRLRTGGDDYLGVTPKVGGLVSIHASAREATADLRHGSFIFVTFQSTPPHGRRPPSLTVRPVHSKFQSTPPHGRRL